MDRRHFLSLSGAGLLSLAMNDAWGRGRSHDSKYSIVILGDTHFDTEPASVYHSDYMEKVDWLNKVQRAEFARNGEMWRDRCPRMTQRAARLITDDTRMVFQMGDLVQGDCGNPDVHRKMLDDTMNYFKKAFGPLPFVTVVGNHDIRGTKAKETYHQYMPGRMSQELGKDIQKTTFDFRIGKDAYLFIDFNNPDDEEVEKMLAETADARYTFVVVHGALFPMDSKNSRWFYHGGASDEETQKRHHFRELFARRNVICLCGHTHTTEYYDWFGDGGHITQMTLNSVWANEKVGHYTIDAQGADQYGELVHQASLKDESIKYDPSIFDDYRAGLKTWTHSRAAGSYKMTVSKRGVKIDFYAGDSEDVTQRFVLR